MDPADRDPWGVPVTQDAFWGPDDRLAIAQWDRQSDPSSLRLAFIEGRTGVTNPVDVELAHPVEALNGWAADGSGILVAWDPAVTDLGPAVARMDGTIVDATEGVAKALRGRRLRADGPSSGLVIGASMPTILTAAPSRS